MSTAIKDVIEQYQSYPQEIKDRFRRFHAKNPEVYQAFRDSAFDMRRTGKKKYSARTIFEVIRWERDLTITGTEQFEINGDFVPMYVRLLIINEPRFAEFFELRAVRSKGRGSLEERSRRAAACSQ